MENPHYSYSPIIEREPLQLPPGKKIAVWIGIAIEHYTFGVPAVSLAPFTSELVPDPLNVGWRDYGPRVGIWRLAEVFDRFAIRPTGIVNSEVCHRYPQIIREGKKRDWCWVAHGANNSTWQTAMSESDERAYLAQVTEDLEAALGTRPKGWLGPALTASHNTNTILAELGYRYTLDWSIDDEPVPLAVNKGSFYSVPYSAELNDLPFSAIHGQTGPDFCEAIIDQFEQMRGEGEQRPRVMGFGVHPFLTGQPYRARHFARALDHMTKCEDAWFVTADEIVALRGEETMPNAR